MKDDVGLPTGSRGGSTAATQTAVAVVFLSDIQDLVVLTRRSSITLEKKREAERGGAAEGWQKETLTVTGKTLSSHFVLC